MWYSTLRRTHKDSLVYGGMGAVLSLLYMRAPSSLKLKKYTQAAYFPSNSIAHMQSGRERRGGLLLLCQCANSVSDGIGLHKLRLRSQRSCDWMTSASCSSSSLPVPCDQWLCVPQSPGILYHPRRLCHKRFVHTEWLPGARGTGERGRFFSSFKRQRSASTSRWGVSVLFVALRGFPAGAVWGL